MTARRLRGTTSDETRAAGGKAGKSPGGGRATRIRTQAGEAWAGKGVKERAFELGRLDRRLEGVLRRVQVPAGVLDFPVIWKGLGKGSESSVDIAHVPKDVQAGRWSIGFERACMAGLRARGATHLSKKKCHGGR